MLLQDVFNQFQDNQLILSLSNNNDVLITSDCFNTQSKFYRRSKVRLGVDFHYVGYISNNVFVRLNDINNAPSGSVLIFRTYRGNNKSDYALYIFSEYKMLEHYKKQLSYKRIMNQSDKQLTMNSITKPIPDNVLDVCSYVCPDKTYYVSYKNHSLKSGLYYSPLYTNDMAYNYLGYYAGVIIGLQVAKKYADRINLVRISADTNMKGIYKFPLKEWKPVNPYMIDYTNRVLKLKHDLELLGVSIQWMCNS